MNLVHRIIFAIVLVFGIVGSPLSWAVEAGTSQGQFEEVERIGGPSIESEESFQDWGDSPLTRISRGNFLVSTSQLGIGVNGNDGVHVSVQPQVDYFVVDRLGVGGVIGVNSHIGGVTSLDLGPSASYHFWEDKNFSSFLGSQLIFSNVTSINGLYSGLKLVIAVGGNYHFSPFPGWKMAVGPKISWEIADSTGAMLVDLINLSVYF